MNQTAFDALKLLGNMKAYNISPVFESNMPGFWNNPGCWIAHDSRTYAQDYYYCQTLILGEHIGAHIDAPCHCIEGAKCISDFEPGHWIAPYKKIDLTSFNPEAGWEASPADIKSVMERDGLTIEPGDIVLLVFGWDKHYLPHGATPEQRAYYGSNSPGISDECCQFFIDLKIKAVGSDTCHGTIASKNKVGSPASHNVYLLPNEITIIEGLINLTPIPLEGIFAALPMRIKDGSGSPISPIVFA